MKPSTRIPLRLFTATSSPLASSARRSTCAAAAAAAAFNARASISTTPLKPAEVAPVVGTGPPPEPPIADIAAEDRAAAARIRVERRKKQAEMLKHAKRIRTSAEAKASAPGALKRRFWNDVSVQEVDGMFSPPPHYFSSLVIMACLRRDWLTFGVKQIKAPSKSTSTPVPSATPTPRKSSASRPRSSTSPRPSPSNGTSSPRPSRRPSST